MPDLLSARPQLSYADVPTADRVPMAEFEVREPQIVGSVERSQPMDSANIGNIEPVEGDGAAAEQVCPYSGNRSTPTRIFGGWIAGFPPGAARKGIDRGNGL